MKRVFFIDLDGVVVEQGTQNLLNGALESLQKLSTMGDIYFFSSWAFNQRDIDFLASFNIPFGIIRKPTADEYVYIDDKLNISVCGIKLS